MFRPQWAILLLAAAAFGTTASGSTWQDAWNCGRELLASNQADLARVELEAALEGAYGSGPDSPSLIAPRLDLAAAQEATFDEASARRTLEEAVVAARDWANFEQEVESLEALGDLLARGQNRHQAEKKLVDALILRKAISSDDDPVVGDILEKIGLLYAATHKIPEARQRLYRSLAIAEKTYGSEAEVTAMRAARLAMTLDDPEQKEALLRNVLAILVREPKPPAKKIEAVLVNYEKARADCGIGPQGESRGRLRAALAAAKPELIVLLRPPDERNLAATELDLNPYGGIERPVLIRRADPLYPEEARKRRIEGVVVLEALISRNGDPTEIKILRSLDAQLDRESVKAVTAWKYQPAKIGECAIPTYTTVTVTFRLSH